MKDIIGVRNGHRWNRYIVLRVLLAAGSLISFVIASGAGGRWT